MTASPPFAPPRDRAARALWRVDDPTGLPVPRYDGRSIVNLAVSVHRAGGGDRSPRAVLAPPLDPDLDPFGGRSHPGPIVVFLVDGLGWAPFREWASTAGAAAETWAGHARPITTVFPSTTTAALVSLSTGVAPGRHGLIGYRQYLPKFGVVGDMLSMSPVGSTQRDALIGPSWTPSTLTAAPTLFRQGLRTTALTRDIFEGTGFTRLLYDGAEFVGYATATHLVHQLAALLQRPRPPRVVFLYWADLDTIQHLVGPHPGRFHMEMDRLVDLLERTAAEVGPRVARSVTFAITGDHGQVRANPAKRVAVDEEPAILREMVRPLAGDRRAGFFAARPHRVAALTEALQRRLAPGTPVVGREEVARAGLFGPGPFHPELEERVGDVIAFVRAPECLTYLPPGAHPPKRFLLGAHGGVDAEELVVPLVSGSLAELGARAARARSTKR
ncbi:MAG TPA: alkaline phosphatase family protein [Thermoplasmata archaeon]|nr:alkaline phosphatase family protein [Thermoplasmata archaeon]